jgi:hypothetical protein
MHPGNGGLQKEPPIPEESFGSNGMKRIAEYTTSRDAVSFFNYVEWFGLGHFLSCGGVIGPFQGNCQAVQAGPMLPELTPFQPMRRPCRLDRR